jgi:hypothetical protein
MILNQVKVKHKPLARTMGSARDLWAGLADSFAFGNRFRFRLCVCVASDSNDSVDGFFLFLSMISHYQSSLLNVDKQTNTFSCERENN